MLTLASAVRIRVMSGRAVRITARIIFVICGLASLLTGVPYVLLRGVDLPVQSEWVIFAIILGLVGVSSVAAGVLPRRWIAKACRKDRDDPSLFSAPLKLLAGTAVVFYLVAAVGDLAPHRWDLDPQLMLAVCPLYFLKLNVDPSLTEAFFLLAPLNASVYGALGMLLGYVWLRFRRGQS